MAKVAPSLAALANTRKVETRVIGPVTRHLLAKDLGEGRRQDCVHPSEAARSDWCPRHDYYRIAVARGELDIEVAPQVGSSLWLEKIFDDGHISGRKWQDWVRGMGMLRGEWRCLYCDPYGTGSSDFMATSPKKCPHCGVTGWDVLKYLEVPCESKEFLLYGRADGDVDEPGVSIDEQVLFENKYLGTGSLKFEVPKKVRRYEFEVDGRTYVDWEKLWFELRRPFPAHAKQLLLYMMCQERKVGVVIYEPKFTSGNPREFLLRYNVKYIEPILDSCLDVVYALEKGRAPQRPVWAERDHGVCKSCPFAKGCWGTKKAVDSGQASSNSGQRRNGATKEAGLRSTSGTTRPGRHGRPSPDEAVHEAGPISRLSIRSSSRGRGAGGGSRTFFGGR